MSSEMQWLIGISLTVLVTMATMLVAAFRALSTKIDEGNDDLAKTMKAGDDHLHERVNKVREDYVRRVDLDNHLTRIDQTLREVRDEQREMNRALIAALPKARQPRT